jgi:hypothetical protein
MMTALEQIGGRRPTALDESRRDGWSADKSERWTTSWYWTWRPISTPPPSAPQVIADERAVELSRLLTSALAHDAEERVSFLALAHARLSSAKDLAQVARLEYRVSLGARFPDGDSAHGAARKAIEHVKQLDAAGQLAPTRGPFHLSEILVQGGLAAITLRSDLLQNESSLRLATYVPLAITRGGGPFEPMHFGLLDVTTDKLIWCPDDVLSHAWHAPMAGGEILALLPAFAAPQRTRWSALPDTEAGHESGPRASIARPSKPTVARH